MNEDSEERINKAVKIAVEMIEGLRPEIRHAATLVFNLKSIEMMTGLPTSGMVETFFQAINAAIGDDKEKTAELVNEVGKIVAAVYFQADAILKKVPDNCDIN